MTKSASALASETIEKNGKKLIGVEKFLGWAYRNELPKTLRNATVQTVSSMPDAWGAIERYGELLTIVDVSPNGFGCIPDVWSEDEMAPHADALVAAGAVAELAATEMEWEEGLDVLADLPELTDAERADCNRRGYAIARARGQQLAALVMRRAMIGGAPDWTDHGPVDRQFVRNGPRGVAWFRIVSQTFGKNMPAHEVEVDGYDAVAKRPFSDAYRKTFLNPDPALLAAERIDYQAWVMALEHVAWRVMEMGLVAHQVLGPNKAMFPWEGEAVPYPRPRVLLAATKKIAEPA
ncbi:hypothetical protein [Aureimonas sp. AU40]|uniref:hypothetical protein n=1 Tax=Aureimonas sp. AU40 TaxID=1637747 RepID=UPI0007845466|nr:hypothetical protein [Aureimonas sp. AU40]